MLQTESDSSQVMESEDKVTSLPPAHSSSNAKAYKRASFLKQVITQGLPSIHNKEEIIARRNLTPMSWSEFFDEKKTLTIAEDTFNVYLKGTSGPVFLLLHGGGYAGLTWSCFAKELTELIDCRIVAPDLRGHGLTHCVDESDLSTDRQVKDILNIVNSLYGSDEHNLEICIIGHSMGGALAVHTTATNRLEGKLVGLIVIDVVEGTAVEALGGMVHYLHTRPSTFKSEEKAIEWCLISGNARNVQAARVSMPSQIRESGQNEFTWRIDLTRTEEHWKGWFEGISNLFMGCSAPKLLALANVDRLDRSLTIGQMQGKFQTCVLPKVGHCVQEDSPDKLAEEVARFAVRFKFAQPKPGSAKLLMAPKLPMSHIM